MIVTRHRVSKLDLFGRLDETGHDRDFLVPCVVTASLSVDSFTENSHSSLPIETFARNEPDC